MNLLNAKRERLLLAQQSALEAHFQQLRKTYLESLRKEQQTIFQEFQAKAEERHARVVSECA